MGGIQLRGPETIRHQCPRCAKALVRNHDELVCLVHGTVATPRRAWDAASANVGAGIIRQRHAETTTHRLSARDRAILAGDESAFEHEERDTMEDERGFDITSTKALGELCIERVRGLLRDVAKLDEAVAARRTEIRRFLQIAKFCEVAVPAELQRATGGSPKPRPIGMTMPPPGENWKCPDCGWESRGRFPGRHPAACAARRAAATG